jgi:hypothetical protein
MRKKVPPNVSRGGKLIERRRVVVVVLRKHCHLMRARHEDILLVRIVGPQLIFGAAPLAK